MAHYDNTNRGILFRNQKRHDRQPDYRGTIDVNGVEYTLSAWLKISTKGTKFFSLAVSPSSAPPSAHPASPAGDDIPF